MSWLLALLAAALGCCVVALGWRFKSPMTFVLGVFLAVMAGVFYAATINDSSDISPQLGFVAFIAGLAFIIWGGIESKASGTQLPLFLGFFALTIGVVYGGWVSMGVYFPAALIIIGILMVSFVLAYDRSHPGRIREMTDTLELGEFELKPTVPKLGFADIGGLRVAKDALKDLVLGPLKNPLLAARYGKDLSGGILLYGPPGCGKTLLAEAAAKEGDMAYYEIRISDILSKWMGSSEKRLSRIFDEARRKAPALVFLDEIDGLGLQRGMKLAEDPSRIVLSQLLIEMDRVREDTKVFIVAATNMPWDVDAALLRPGRFDERVFVPPPDADARKQIFGIHTRKLRENGMLARDVDLGRLAALTPGLSGADIKDTCQDSANRAWRIAFAGGTAAPVTMTDFEETITRQTSSITRWIQIAERYTSTASASEFTIEVKGLVDDIKSGKIPGYG